MAGSIIVSSELIRINLIITFFEKAQKILNYRKSNNQVVIDFYH